jgi:osmotically-inducible protein OsmY
MTAHRDSEMQKQILGMFERAGLPLAVDVRDGVARVTGYVDSEADYQTAMDILASVDDIVEVSNEIEVVTTAPDSAFEEESTEEEFDYAETPAWSTGDDFEFDPDFADDYDANAISYQQAVEEAEPFFPPTDPVVRPRQDREDLEVAGGSQDTSMDELSEEIGLNSSEYEMAKSAVIRRDDEAIREDILRELREDATTADLNLDIEVIDGVVLVRGEVHSLDDSLNVEDVSGRVPGVVEVRDETIIQQ